MNQDMYYNLKASDALALIMYLMVDLEINSYWATIL